MLPTWEWRTPTLTDTWAFTGVDIDDVPVGTQVGYKTHRYRIGGPRCAEADWLVGGSGRSYVLYVAASASSPSGKILAWF